MVSISRNKDFWTGFLFSAIAVAGLWLGRDFPVGTTQNMGTGYFPRLVCGGLLLLGLILGGRAFFHGGEQLSDWDWRPFVLVPLSVALFGFFVEPAGLVVATLALILIGSIAAREVRWWETVIAAVVLAAFSSLAFVVGLRLQIDLWPEF